MKNIFKKFLIGTLTVVAFVVTANLALASYDFGSATLKVGSRGQYVITLQTLVGATPADGNFGPITKAKVVAWQKAHGLITDGLFGPVSKAKASETGTNFGAGCTNASGFSITTGLPCSSLNANTFPAGCSNASGFSTTTGYLCLTNLPRVISGGGSGGSSHHDTSVTEIGAITGILQVGQELTAGAVTPSGATVDYQWQIGDIAGGLNYGNIEGETESTYTILASDVGKYLDVTATGTGSYSDSVKSAPTTVITPAIISATAIAGVTVPATGETPVTIVTAGTGYTGTVAWSPNDGALAGGTVYTATITLTATEGYTLSGVTENQFTIAGVTGIATNSADSGVITAIFPATATTISTAVIAGVTVPLAGETPDTTVTAGTGYTATITWVGNPTTFSGNTAYTATITLTPTTSYTLTGVTADLFTVFGATATNSANTGVITATFPATKTSIVGEPIVGVTAPITDAAPDTTADAGTGFTITSVVWAPVNNPFNGGVVYTATITIAPDGTHTLYGIALNSFTVDGATTTNAANSGVITAVFPATAIVDRTSGAFATTIGNNTVTITLTGGTFKAGPIVAGDFTFAGTDNLVLAGASTFTRTNDTVVTITGIGALAGGDNTVLVKALTQATQASSVAGVASTAITDVTSENYTTAGANTTITITLTSGTFKAGQLAASDFTFGGTGAEAIANALEIAAHGVFSATTGSGTIVAITGLNNGPLVGSSTNTVTVKAATQATQAASVAAIAS